MFEHPKLVAQFLDAEKITQNSNSAISHLKINGKGLLGIFEKKTQGTKFHELENLAPCIFLDFTKLVWPILATTKMWTLLNSNTLWTRATVFECCKRILQRWQSWTTQKKWLCQTWGWGEVACEQNKCNNNSLAPHWITLITKQMGSNPKAKQDHHMKYHQHPPWQVTSSTDKVKYMVILLGITCGVSQLSPTNTRSRPEI